jgi:hypothetical protein
MIKTGINEGGERAGQPWTHVVCDSTGIILEDGVCLYPGYVEIQSGQVIQNFSDDPHNAMGPAILDSEGKPKGPNPEFSVGMLKNRVEFRRTENLGAAPAHLSDGQHFLDLDTMHRYETLMAADVPPAEPETAPEVEESGEVADDVPTDGEIPEPTVTEVDEVVIGTPEVAEVQPEPEEVAESEETATVDMSDEAAEEEPSAEESEETPPTETPEVDQTEESETVEVSAPHLIDVNGIHRCNVCMSPVGAIGDSPEAIAAHLDAHVNPVEPKEEEPTGGMMTTENTAA